MLNYLQAHDPWVVPDPKLGWDLLDPQMLPEEFKSGFALFLQGKLEPPDARLVHHQLTGLYDYGVYREDAALRRSPELPEPFPAIESGEKRQEEVDPALVEQLRALGYVE